MSTKAHDHNPTNHYNLTNPFTVSAIFCDGSGTVISHPVATDAQTARDQVLMQTGGAVIIVSVFEGHLVEPDGDPQFPAGTMLTCHTSEEYKAACRELRASKKFLTVLNQIQNQYICLKGTQAMKSNLAEVESLSRDSAHDLQRGDRQNNVSTLAGHRAIRAAARTGKQTQEIEQLPFDLSVIDEEGAFLNVDARGFGILDRRIDWQSLGITLPKETDVAFHPPRCGVLPNRYRRPLLTPATQAHTALKKYSYQFRLTETLFQSPEYRWLPWRAFSEFEREFSIALDNLNKAKRTVLENYDLIRSEVLETFTKLANDSAQRLLATGIVVNSDFRESIRNGVLDALPTEEEISDKLVLRYQPGVILLGSEMLREQRLAIEEKNRIEHLESERRIELSKESAAKTRIQQELWTSQETTRLRLVAQEEDLKREAEVKERIRQLKLKAAREKIQETLNPLQEGAAQLRAQVHESAIAMYEALTKNNFLPGATAKKARNMARWFRLMNFQSDN